MNLAYLVTCDFVLWFRQVQLVPTPTKKTERQGLETRKDLQEKDLINMEKTQKCQCLI